MYPMQQVWSSSLCNHQLVPPALPLQLVKLPFPCEKLCSISKVGDGPSGFHATVSQTTGVEAIHRRVGFSTGASASWHCRRLYGLVQHERTTDGNSDACTNGSVRQHPNVLSAYGRSHADGDGRTNAFNNGPNAQIYADAKVNANAYANPATRNASTHDR